MKIWLINDYNMLPEHGHHNRNYYLAKYLKRLGHEPVVFVGSHPHNSHIQLIEDKAKFKVYREEPFPWVLIKTENYEGNRKKRVFSMFEFYRNMKIAAKNFEKPDVIIGSSAHPLAALSAIKLGKKYNAKGIVEIRDLWPESIVVYTDAKRNNPIIKMLYRFEKYLYIHADKIIFLFENAYMYFTENGLDKYVSRDKVCYLNNGVDLEEFEINLKENVYHDDDIDNDNYFKVVYTGSIRKANNLDLLIDAAKLVQNRSVRFIVYGEGDEKEMLQRRIIEEGVTNVVFKGHVEKKYIASITSKADLNILHAKPAPTLKYGISMNKLFDYAAAGKPILADFHSDFNPLLKYKAGEDVISPSAIEIAKAVDKMSSLDKATYDEYCNNARKMAHDFSFEYLASKMIDIVK